VRTRCASAVAVVQWNHVAPARGPVPPVGDSEGESVRETTPDPAVGADEAARGETARPDAGREEQASEDVMRLLSEHVPLTLLADLAQPTGPDSPEILEDEGLPDVAWWEPTADEGAEER